METCWLFLCLGGAPNTDWTAAAGILRDEEDYLVTGPDCGSTACAPKAGHSIASRTIWKRMFPACLPRAMSATDLSNGVPRPLARAQWLSHLCIGT